MSEKRDKERVRELVELADDLSRRLVGREGKIIRKRDHDLIVRLNPTLNAVRRQL